MRAQGSCGSIVCKMPVVMRAGFSLKKRQKGATFSRGSAGKRRNSRQTLSVNVREAA
jgi:hypothetical protein